MPAAKSIVALVVLFCLNSFFCSRLMLLSDIHKFWIYNPDGLYKFVVSCMMLDLPKV